MQRLLQHVASVHEVLFSSLQNYQHEGSVVIAIDKASVCPLFVRAIIADRRSMERAVLDGLKKFGMTVQKAVFSVAGTGASRGSIGSDPDNWVAVDTSASLDAVSVYSVLRGQKE